ncbi:23S rRNA (uracil1939-C5)-methyltransferase [Oceanospirillum multiglobuliferum]|uniref:23S rRNA (uracil(1939)-C(5))-methyltransferase RlmD n=1 Tax=Oceanospirillum multiglobuliferum TaxID=64969 RepID=A0A1T4Q3X9_9GAMM|nr:23S rRNA (uracil(1939)-C(5))-methyltransferase RlmD [Oceanospirillum multiglobuliferum]OPX55500.1 hypothetical protein BTE48_08935 [Oceanospirillum multiglobuliferum]SJZ98221.1 23S rRNA (uracil1939-C5)-methyltransferase [Oceanospirillum multiglobuliferum]
MPELEIERQGHDGRGIAHLQGKIIFVEGALVGETVQAKITKQHKKFDEALCEQVLVASANRVEPACEYYQQCGGCSLQHLGIDAQRQVKSDALTDQLQRFGKVETINLQAPLLDEAWHYRRKARLGVKWTKQGELLVGFREKGSPHLKGVHHCAVLTKPLSALISTFYDLIPQLESKKTIGHLELAQGDDGCAVVVRHLKTLSQADLKLWLAWAHDHNVRLYLQTEGHTSLKQADGSELTPLNYQVGDVKMSFLPNDFFQVNAAINAKMVQQALIWAELKPTDQVLDLFSGFGNFSLAMAPHVASITGVEGEKTLVERARANAVLNGIDNAFFETADLSQPFKKQSWVKKDYDLVLLDPPRTGAQEICEQIKAFGAKRVLYVSCNPSTLARDSAILQSKGFKLVQAGIMDMFPHTTHVESMALFKRK